MPHQNNIPDQQTQDQTSMHSGHCFHHLLTGLDPKRLAPFEAEKIPARTVNSKLSIHIQNVISKALRSNRNKRYKDIKSMRIDLLTSPHIIICTACGTILRGGNNRCSRCGLKTPIKKNERQKRDRLLP